MNRDKRYCPSNAQEEYRPSPCLSGVLVRQGSLRCSRRVFLSLLRQQKQCRQEAAVVGRHLHAQRCFRAEARQERRSITAVQSPGTLPGCTTVCAGRAAPSASSCPASRQALCKALGGPLVPRARTVGKIPIQGSQLCYHCDTHFSDPVSGF